VNRREFITLLGGTAAWPFAARAQQPAMPVIGFLGTLSPEGFNEQMRGFRQGLRESGYVESENLKIEYRWADSQTDRLPALAADLVSRRVAVIATAGGPPAVLAAKAATTTVPVVFITGDDPIRLGFVTNLARPDGNLTGVSFFNAELAAKRLAMLRELVPAAARIAVLVNPAIAAVSEATVTDLEQPARAMGVQLRVLTASNSREINATFDSLERERPDALFVGPGSFFLSRRVQLAHLASRHAVPAAYAERDFVEVGGLMSYGASLTEVLSSDGRLCRPHPQRRATRRASGPAREQVRAGHQRGDGTAASPHDPADAARDRRRGDRVKRRAFITLLGGAAASMAKPS
jgi:putative tryptophan/tyrosine transport system substrate-binding protein